MQENADKSLINGLKKGDIASFEKLYKKYYVYLCLVSQQIVKEPLDAEEIASDVFVKLWIIRDRIGEIESIKAYLIKSVRNSSINHIRHLCATTKGALESKTDFYECLDVCSDDYPLGHLMEEETIKIIEKGISELPEKCRNIFLMSRDHNVKYNDIASQLGISINTVKTQIKIALKRMRILLKDYM